MNNLDNNNDSMESKTYSLLDPLLISMEGSRLIDVPMTLNTDETVAYVNDFLCRERQTMRYFDVQKCNPRTIPSLTNDQMIMNCRTIASQLVNHSDDSSEEERRMGGKKKKHWSEGITHFSLNDLPPPPEPRRHSAHAYSERDGEDQPPYPLHRTWNFCTTPMTYHHQSPFEQYVIYSNATPPPQPQNVDEKRKNILFCRQNDPVIGIIGLEMLGIPQERLRSTIGPLEYTLQISYVTESYSADPFAVEYGLGFFKDELFFFKQISQANRDYHDIVEESNGRAIDEKTKLIEIIVRDYIFNYESTPLLAVRIYPHFDRCLILSVDVKIRI